MTETVWLNLGHLTMINDTQDMKYFPLQFNGCLNKILPAIKILLAIFNFILSQMNSAFQRLMIYDDSNSSQLMECMIVYACVF